MRAIVEPLHGADCRNIAITLIVGATALSGVNEYNHLIYKGECQEKYFSLDRKWRNFP